MEIWMASRFYIAFNWYVSQCQKRMAYDELNYEYFLKTLDISALSFHKLLLIARKHDGINEWGFCSGIILYCSPAYSGGV